MSEPRYSVTLPETKWKVIINLLERAGKRQRQNYALRSFFFDTASHIENILRKQQANL